MGGNLTKSFWEQLSGIVVPALSLQIPPQPLTEDEWGLFCDLASVWTEGNPTVERWIAKHDPNIVSSVAEEVLVSLTNSVLAECDDFPDHRALLLRVKVLGPLAMVGQDLEYLKPRFYPQRKSGPLF